MSNKEYVEWLLSTTDEIYIDTASLMETEEMKLLINNYKDLFLANKCKITVLPAVCLELVKHIGSVNGIKSEKAMIVLELFKENPDLFLIQNTELNENDIANAFADPEIYMQILKDRFHSHRQLLITNDRKLSEDVYNLNKLQSMSGCPVAVCYLNHYGELHKCECVRLVNSKETLCSQNNDTLDGIHTNSDHSPKKEILDDSCDKTTEIHFSTLKPLFYIASGFVLGLGTATLGFSLKSK